MSHKNLKNERNKELEDKVNLQKEIKEWKKKVIDWSEKLTSEIEHINNLIRKGEIKLNKEEEEILILAKSYLKDSLYFLNNKDIFRAIESISISWSYVDSLIKIKKINTKQKGFFTS